MQQLQQELSELINQQGQVQDIHSTLTRNSASNSIIREETLQNYLISESKESQENLKHIIQKSKIDYLCKLQSTFTSSEQEQELAEYIKDFKNNFGYLGSDQNSHVWQILQSLNELQSVNSGLSFITDKNPIQNGGLIFSLLKSAFNLYHKINLVNIFESQASEDKNLKLQLDEQMIETIWDSVIVNGSNNKKTVYFLNLEFLNPSQIIFIAKLQKHLNNLKNEAQIPNIVIYSDDILASQLKEQIKPQLEIVLEFKRMPQKIQYVQNAILSQKSKMDLIEQLIIDALKKYKQTLLRFDVLIFVKNIEESKYLQQHYLNLIKEKLNIIDLTDIEVNEEESKFYLEDFKKNWEKQLVEKKIKEKELKIQQEKEQQAKKIEEELALERERQRKIEEDKNKIFDEEKKLIKEKINQQQVQQIPDVHPLQQINQDELNIPPFPAVPEIQQQQLNLQEIQINQNQEQEIQLQKVQREEEMVKEEEEQKRKEEELMVKEEEERKRIEEEEVRKIREDEENIKLKQLQEEEERKRREEEEIKLKEDEEIKRKQDEENKLKQEEEERQKDIQQYNEDLNKQINKNKQNLYKANEFNIFIAKSYKQLKHHNLDNVIIQIDTGEAFKVYFMDTIFDQIPVVSSKITREEAIKRERLIGNTKSCEIHRLYEKKEFLRLQKRDFLNLINLEQYKAFSEIQNEKCPQKQAIRILLQIMINLSENWFSCSSEVGAHISILWSRMGDIFSVHNQLLVSQTDDLYLACQNLNLQNILEKNQVNSNQYDKIVYKMLNIQKVLNIKEDPVKILQKLEATKFSELVQQVAIEKYWKNLCVYSGHRRLGFRHFESAKMLNYAEISSMNLIQERPFLIIPLQLQINSKNQYEIKQCLAIDHPFLLENAPSQFIEKHQLRLLKRQSLNLHEIEYFGISDALFQYFEDNNQIIKDMENKFDCYYEPNHHMDTITIHSDASQKEKLEKHFNNLLQEAQKILSEEVMEISHGNNCILKIQKGGTIKEVTILQNEHIFIVDNLPLNVKEQDVINLFEEYGDIVQVKFFTDPTLKNVEEKSISAEVLVAETEDSKFFVETFNQIEFQDRVLQLRLKNHSYQIHQDNNSTRYHNIFRWQTWKSKQTGRIEFLDESSVQSFMKLVQNKLIVDGKEIKAEQDKNFNKTVILSGLQKCTDEETLKSCLIPELQKNIVRINVDRIADVDRGISKTSLIFALNKIYKEQHQISWVRRKDHGIVEAKICFSKNYLYKMNTYYERFNSKPDILGQQKLYVQRNYIETFNYDLKMMNVVQMILKGNQELVQMQQKNEIKLKEKIVRPIPSKQEFIVILKCNDETHFNKAKGIMQALLQSKLLDLRNVKLDLASLFDEEDQVDYSQLFTEIGQKKLKEIESKYPVFFKINLIKEEVRVFCTDAIYDLINKDVEYFLRQSVRVKIPISGKNIRNILGIDGRGLEEFKNKTNICKIQLDYISKDIYMEGNSKQVDQAKNALLALLEEKNSQACLNNMPYSYEDCQVCSDTIVTGYRLQGCGHKFCLSCIMFVIDNSLGDVNSLPIKCPFCSQAIIMKDIKTLMSEDQIQKMTRMSLNHYIQNNFQEFSFCVNENCKSIHSSKLTKYTCYECKKTYCSKCAAEYHFGMTCTVYQETEAKNIEFLIKEGARKCPNCGVYIIRIDGCYRVECRRCNQHICWKDNCMKFFATSSECYNHLDENHGGYW
ncbi:RNA recognition motif protein (macronuclear) [Tetrahymena thermophila SB210]|uniref:RNA recognition motif protein n=1 Tax=Tetrahymena thermophila (strain SB210) TaxID=312017 RepID=I7M0I5_TETTS|nr:RNA recognition motif protein [Tetrahymena thermophila SB210]EAR87659.1 RNA recognition motif protein [Tetrahymena thermophila SB210]|eukprot:XP_001007904.1 RNA recognition motif protein [Tetrahymena thermophila SB210]